MSELSQFDHLPIEPVYSQDSPNDPIEFGSIDVTFEHGAKIYSEQANAWLRFVPKDQFLFIIPTKDDSPGFGFELAFSSWDGVIEIGTDRIQLPAMCGPVGAQYGGVNLYALQSGVTTTKPTDTISSVTFHVFNFPDFTGPDDFVLTFGSPPLQGFTRCGRVIVEVDGWVICLSAIRNTSNRVEALRNVGGYIITHVGSIERKDGATFGSSEVEDLLTCLQYFLSFAIGRWAGLALPVGKDKAGSVVFQEWGIRRTAAGIWNASCSWFDERHGELLSEVFPGFYALWKSSLWRRPLSEALYWYLGANDVSGTAIGVDSGVILTQTALELMSWNYCVKDKKMVSEEAFKPRGLSASNKFRLLASAAEIPKDIPPQLTSLNQQKGNKFIDSMQAITEIRNSLVHPDAKSRPDSACYLEAWKLSLWFIDLVLLRLCGHNGKYANRLAERFVGEVQDVPWA